MAVLDAVNRLRCGNQLMRDARCPGAITKAQLGAAVDATDAWIDGNAASFNLALPLEFRTAATLEEKTLLFCYIAMRRAGLLRAEED